MLNVTTFWSFRREFSRHTGSQLPNSYHLIDLYDPGTKMAPWKSEQPIHSIPARCNCPITHPPIANAWTKNRPDDASIGQVP